MKLMVMVWGLGELQYLVCWSIVCRHSMSTTMGFVVYWIGIGRVEVVVVLCCTVYRVVVYIF